MNAERKTQNAEWNADAPYALCANPKLGTPNSKRIFGFTLLEVMIAMFVFFVVVFAVLGMVVQSLGAARALQSPQPDFSILASALTLSNTLEIGCESGDFNDLGEEYAGFDWERCVRPYCAGDEEGTNGLYYVRFVITSHSGRGRQIAEEMEIIVHKPGRPGGVRRRL